MYIYLSFDTYIFLWVTYIFFGGKYLFYYNFDWDHFTFSFRFKKKSLLRNAKYDCWLCFRLIHGRTRYKEKHITKCIMPFFKSIYRIAFFSAGRIFSVFQKNYPKKYSFFVVALVFNFFLMLIIYNLNINHRLFK